MGSNVPGNNALTILFCLIVFIDFVLHEYGDRLVTLDQLTSPLPSPQKRSNASANNAFSGLESSGS